MSSRISDFTLERYLLKELPPDVMRDVELLENGDGTIKERLERMRASNKEILSRYSYDQFRGRIERSLKKNKRGVSRRFMLPAAVFSAFVLIAAAALLLPHYFDGIDRTAVTKGDDTRIFIYRKSGTGNQMLKNGEQARKGDLVQIALLTPGQKYCAVISIDGRGSITRHFPEQGDDSAYVEAKGTLLLNESYELDDAPLFERFFLVTSDARFSVADLESRFRELISQSKRGRSGNIRLDKNERQISFLIDKE